MKKKLIFLLIAILTLGTSASAQRVKFAFGIDGSTPVHKLRTPADRPDTDGPCDTQIWEVGIQGEAQVALTSWLKVNSILNINYEHSKSNHWFSHQGGSGFHFSKYRGNGVAFKLTEYFNFKIYKGWSIGTGPAVRYTTNSYYCTSHGSYTNKYRWSMYWAFGVEKSFGRISARVSWQQNVINTDIYENMLNFAVLYTF